MKRLLAGLLLFGVMLAMTACADDRQPPSTPAGGAAGTTTTIGGVSSTTTTTTTRPVDDSYDKAVAAIAEKRYVDAFRLLKTSTDERAPALLAKFDYVMTSAKLTGENVTCTYDKNGFLVKAVYRSGMTSTYTYTNDAAGRVLTEKMSENGGTYTTEKTYTYENGRLTGTYYTDSYDSWIKEEYSYDAAGRCTKFRRTQSHEAENSTVLYTYDAAGRLLSEDVQAATGSSRTQTYSYDEQGRLSEHKTRLTDDTSVRTYTYDEQGRVIAETVTGYGACSFTYSYGENGLRSGRIYTFGDTVYTQTLTYDEYRCLTEFSSKNDQGGSSKITVTYTDGGKTCTKKGNGETVKYTLFYYPDGVPSTVQWQALYSGWINPNFT